MVSDMCASSKITSTSEKKKEWKNENAPQEKERRRQLEKKRQKQKIARMEMVAAFTVTNCIVYLAKKTNENYTVYTGNTVK
jgi:uncharacterized Ntn-hydrolase superfamily protein